MTTGPDVPEPAVVITLNQMYDEFRGLRDEVKHLSSVVDPALAQVRQDITENKSRIDLLKAERAAEDEKLEQRIRSLENWRAVIFGAAAAVGSLGGWLINYITG